MKWPARPATASHWPDFGQLPKLLLLVLVLASLTIPSHGHRCTGLEKCDCRWIDGKSTANCQGLGLTKLGRLDPDGDIIHVMNLSRNNFVELKKNFFLDANLIVVQRISLQRVGLERVDDKAFTGMTNLVLLDLSHNSLKEVPVQALAALVKLRTLDLQDNQISIIPNSAFNYVIGLKTLSLAKNRIHQIDDLAFSGLDKLTRLSLDDNQILSLSNKVFHSLSKLNTLSISGNPWNCDCKLRPLREFLLANSKISVDMPKCSRSQRVWTEMNLNSFVCEPQLIAISSSNVRVEEKATLKLECALKLAENVDVDPTPIVWMHDDVKLTNTSQKCLSNELCDSRESQKSIVVERIENSTEHLSSKLKVSRLEVLSVRPFDAGVYKCQAENFAGKAKIDFLVDIMINMEDGKFSILPHSTSFTIKDDETGNNPNNILFGLVLGVVFGFILVLIVFLLVLFRRRRTYPTHNHIPEFNLENYYHEENDADNEKLNKNCMINPIQKPPRLGLLRNSNDNSAILRLIELNNINGMTNQSEASESLLPIAEFDDNVSETTCEADLIHPSAYVRNQVKESDEMSFNSEGTEV